MAVPFENKIKAISENPVGTHNRFVPYSVCHAISSPAAAAQWRAPRELRLSDLAKQRQGRGAGNWELKRGRGGGLGGAGAGLGPGFDVMWM